MPYLNNIIAGILSGSTLNSNIGSVKIQVIDSDVNTTSVRRIARNKSLILVDIGLLGFIAKMNRVYITAIKRRKPQVRLTSQVLTYCASKNPLPKSHRSTPCREHNFPRFGTAGLMESAYFSETELHCTFLLAHELAHIELGHLDSYKPKTAAQDSVFGVAGEIIGVGGGKIPAGAYVEQETDIRAVDLSLQTFAMKIMSDAGLSMTFIVLSIAAKYFLWLARDY